jgi:amino acid transporter
MLYALAREGVLPKVLARLSAQALVPRRAVLLVAGVVLALVPWFELSTVVQSMPSVLAVNLCVVYLLALCSWLKLKQMKQARPSLRSSMPVWPVLAAMAVLAIVLCDALASHLSSGVALVMLGELVLIGSVTALRPVPEALVEQ